MKNTLVLYGVKYYPSKGGTSRVVESLIKELKDSFNIKIYCYKNKDANEYIKGIKAVQIPEMPFGAIGVFIYYLLSALHLLFTQNRNCIIHAHKTDCAFCLPLLKLKFKKIVATSHEAPYRRDKWNGFTKGYFRLMEYVFIYSNVTLTSISKPLAKYYNDKYDKNVLFIPNGIKEFGTIDIYKGEDFLHKCNIIKPYIIFAARRIMSTKGLHTMLEALLLMGWKDNVVIAGDTSHNIKYVNKIKHRYSGLNLLFVGYLDLPVLSSIIKLSDLFIFPSETEGMSIMLLEVMIVGSHIICSDIPENKLLFTEDEVLFFKNKDAKDLMDKIYFALENKSNMEQRSMNAKNKIKKEYYWPVIAQEYKALYEKL